MCVICCFTCLLHFCFLFAGRMPPPRHPPLEGRTDGRTPPRNRGTETAKEQRDRDRQGTEGQRPPRSQGKLKLRIFSIFTLVKLIRLRCVCHLLFYMFATYLFSVYRTHAAPAPPPLGRNNRRTEGHPPRNRGTEIAKDTPQEQRDRDRQGAKEN